MNYEVVEVFVSLGQLEIIKNLPDREVLYYALAAIFFLGADARFRVVTVRGTIFFCMTRGFSSSCFFS